MTGDEEHFKRDTFTLLQGGRHQFDTMALHKDALRRLKELPPLPQSEGMENDAQDYHKINDEKYARLSEWVEQQRHQFRPTLTVSRWPSTSDKSVTCSERTVHSSTPPSLYHGGSRSSSRMSDALPAEPPSPTISYSPGRPGSTHGNTPVCMEERTGLQRYYTTFTSAQSKSSACQTSRRKESPMRQSNSRSNSSVRQIHCRTDIHSRTESPVRQQPSRCLTPTFASGRPYTPAGSERNPNGSRNASPEPRGRSHLDTSPMLHLLRPVPSSSQISITPSVKSTITTAAQEKMMSGRPCKDNNYWGFCKGSWSSREDATKGLVLTTRPEGMFTTSQVWQCRHCLFESLACSIPHPTKTNKKEAVVDNKIHTSATGIRYRWMFLVKSHAKKTSYSCGGRNSANEDSEGNFGCVICSVEGTMSGIYGGVESLMDHIANEHVFGGSINYLSMARNKIIVGRIAGQEEEWDVNVPFESLLF